MTTTLVRTTVWVTALLASLVLASRSHGVAKVAYWFPLEAWAPECDNATTEGRLLEKMYDLQYEPIGRANVTGVIAPFAWYVDHNWPSLNAFIVMSQSTASDGSVIVNAYWDAADRDLAFTTYFHGDEVHYDKTGTWNGFYTIELTRAGVAAFAAGSRFRADGSAVGAFYGHSAADGNWQLWVEGNTGNVGMVGANAESDIDDVCANGTNFIYDMTCGDGPPYYDTVGLAAQHSGTVRGNPNARLNPQRDCYNQQAVIMARLVPGAVEWQVRDGHADAEYLVRWFSPGGDVDTLGVVVANAAGQGAWCAYSLPFGGLPGEGEVLELRSGSVEAASDLFSEADSTGGWNAVAPGSCEALVGAPADAVGDSVDCWREGSVVRIPLVGPQMGEESDCADVMTYMVSGQFGWTEWATVLLPHIAQYTSEEGFGYRVRGFAGTNNPSSAHVLYESVRQSNLAWNASHPEGRQYPAYPLLMVVGTGVLPMQREGDGEICPAGHCLSYSLITDTNGDGRPDGPVTWIPATEVDGLTAPCTSADEFNSGELVDPSGAAALFMGDCYYQGGCNSAWDEAGAERIRAAYELNGHPVRPTLRQTSYGEWQAGMAGQACLDGGVRDLWIRGLATNPRKLTWFLAPWDHPTTTEQRIMVLAPDCGSLGYWDWADRQTLREMMFPQYYGGATLVAGAIGCITAGYGPQHDLCRDMLLYEMGEAEPGTLYAEIARRVADDVYELDPDYARGLVTLGGIVKYPGGVSVSEVAAQADRPESGLRWVRGADGSGQFQYALDATWETRLEVFDIQGRKVSVVDAGSRAGHVVTMWRPGDLPTGLYFGRLELRRDGESRTWVTKVLVVR